MDELWETVHTTDDYYDGPRGGVADFGGTPHYYRSIYLDVSKWNPNEDRFELTPLPQEAFHAALELQAIYERWYRAYRAGTAPDDPDDERVLPADRQRRKELQQVLETGRASNSSRTVLVRGKFDDRAQRVQWRVADTDSKG